jgi:hypothetical protein
MQLKITTLAGPALIVLTSFVSASDIYGISKPGALIIAKYGDVVIFCQILPKL